MKSLAGQTAIVTGGGTGIGRAIAGRFHEEGARVVICGRRREQLDRTVQAISPAGERILAVTADVTRVEDIFEVIGTAVSETGGVDILVNNAGLMRFGKLDESDVDSWDLMMKTNAFAPWRFMVAVLPEMRKRGGGAILNISSIAGIRALPGAGIYCASKAALQVLTQVLALETAAEGIRVNAICPAVVEDTELADPIFGTGKVREFYNTMRPLHPLGRNGKPSDIADAALFLVSPQSSWITGVLLSVDGGRHLATNRPIV
ncbi:MAG TPA: SDR family oxidoreductase [Syntrophales bacterium]|nr:SDR family oxidoreductase [Syntrophales bacterium]HQB30292.1 SDR family oxidoreductase [Syntrophales bacterium]HQN77806.1 SDR family oxidoreductase [Syntrophales bacterium]HQQ27345.1 SDR family oxidoreductase [Syntrophales bacterium]